MTFPQFGQRPFGDRLKKIQLSKNYRDGKFQNLSFTPQLAEGYSMPVVLFEFLFKRTEKRRPAVTIPSVKTNLLTLPAERDILVWFGHSSYFIQIDGKKILVDPVFSGNVSPVPGTSKAFPGADVYSVDDLPAIDYLLISHDHYDHLDFSTIMALQTKVAKVITGLGVGAHFEYWGYPANKIVECDWHETFIEDGFTIRTTPARHFSGRSFSRNNTLWLSFVLETPSMKLFLGGDSGYDTHFKEIGDTYGPFDLAIIEDGQYDLKWRYIHMLPEEVLKASQELKAERTFAVHNSKFALANHSWDEPLERVTKLFETANRPVITPMIGEAVELKNKGQQFSRWWQGLK